MYMHQGNATVVMAELHVTDLKVADFVNLRMSI